jgi:hypothetical protein
MTIMDQSPKKSRLFGIALPKSLDPEAVSKDQSTLLDGFLSAEK